MNLERQIQLWTDFHNPRKTGEHTSTIGVGGGTLIRPEAGEEVTLFDGEGNTCRAVVEGVFDVSGYILVHTRADPLSFTTEPQIPDLMDALRGSLAAHRSSRRQPAMKTQGGLTEETRETSIRIA